MEKSLFTHDPISWSRRREEIELAFSRENPFVSSILFRYFSSRVLRQLAPSRMRHTSERSSNRVLTISAVFVFSAHLPHREKRNQPTHSLVTRWVIFNALSRFDATQARALLFRCYIIYDIHRWVIPPHAWTCLSIFSPWHTANRSTRTRVDHFSLVPDRFHLIDNGSFKSNSGRLSAHHGKERRPFKCVRCNRDALLFLRLEVEV